MEALDKFLSILCGGPNFVPLTKGVSHCLWLHLISAEYVVCTLVGILCQRNSTCLAVEHYSESRGYLHLITFLAL